MIDKFVVERLTSTRCMTDDEALEASVRVGDRRLACLLYLPHGPLADDPMAWSDTQSRVKGVQGPEGCRRLGVPVVPWRTRIFPTLMTAEKILSMTSQPCLGLSAYSRRYRRHCQTPIADLRTEGLQRLVVGHHLAR